MRIKIKNKQGALKIKCQEIHEEITGYNIEPDKQYCTESRELQGISCVKYRRFFVENKGDDVVVPTIKCTIDICSGRQKYKCKHSLCHKYHMEKLRNSGVRKRLLIYNPSYYSTSISIYSIVHIIS